jgi:DNA-binding XRE family transcriptional regulator
VDARKRKKLEAAGFRVGTVAEFLGLTEAEARFVDLKAALALRLTQRRNELSLTQQRLARQLGSSQSRVAKMEAADETVSLDLLVRALFAMGVSSSDLADVIRHSRLKRARRVDRRSAGPGEPARRGRSVVRGTARG